MIFYTYLWRDPAGNPFYVGKGSGNRAWSVSRRSNDFMAVFNLGGCSVEIVDEFIHESDAHAHEVALIAKFGRREFGGLLVNKTDGGEGTINPSSETRAKRSASMKGKKKSPESIEKTAAALRGRKRPPEVRQKIREARLGKPPHPKVREMLVHFAHNVSAETRAKLSQASKGRKHSAEAKAKMAAWHLGRPRAPETMEKIALANRMAPPKGSSGYKGVKIDKSTMKWIATARRSGKQVHLGTFRTKEEAALAYDKAAYDEWGDSCYLNFPELIRKWAA